MPLSYPTQADRAASLTAEEKIVLRGLLKEDCEQHDTIPHRVLYNAGYARAYFSRQAGRWMLTVSKLGREIAAEIEVRS